MFDNIINVRLVFLKHIRLSIGGSMKNNSDASNYSMDSFVDVSKDGSSPKKPKKFNNNRLMETMSKRTLMELQQMQQNAFYVLAGLGSPKQKIGTAKKILQAIDGEIAKRYSDTLSGDDYFVWPSIDTGDNLGGELRVKWLAEGLFSFYGYHVGVTNGESQAVRRVILQQIFSRVVPHVFPLYYLQQLGQPLSAQRLKKMAESLAQFVKNAKRRNVDYMDCSIREWEEDLAYLYEKYYVEKFHFGWPGTKNL